MNESVQVGDGRDDIIDPVQRRSDMQLLFWMMAQKIVRLERDVEKEKTASAYYRRQRDGLITCIEELKPSNIGEVNVADIKIAASGYKKSPVQKPVEVPDQSVISFLQELTKDEAFAVLLARLGL